MADINLLQNQVKDTTQTSTRRTKVVAVLVVFILLLLCSAGAGLYIMTGRIEAQTTDVNADNQKQQALLDAQRNSLLEAEAYQAQLSNIKALLDHHISFSPIVAELAKYTYQKASYTVFDVAQDTGKVHIEGTVDSYTGLGKLLLGLSTSAQFSNVKLLAVNQTGTEKTGFTFAIDMKASPDSFIKQQ